MLPGVVDIQKLEVRRQRCVIGPANNCQFRMILKIILKKESSELQASSSKQRLTTAQG
jgi:hypothetical protein